jgi:hypothetical protein
MPVTQSITVLATDDRIWLDADTLVLYLRDIEEQAAVHLSEARNDGYYPNVVAAHSARELARQIADGIVLTSMMAAEKLRTRREPRG